MQKQRVTIPGPCGDLEALLLLPEKADYKHFAIICHPHPQQEGTMDNKVVTTIAKAFNACHIPSIRFNFRGVGDSAGSYGNIHGEVEDCMAIVNWVRHQWPNIHFYLAGFSFGAYIAAEVSTRIKTKHLITVAPSVERMPYYQLPRIMSPWLVIQGEEDEVVNPEAVYKWYDQLTADKTMVTLPETGHFFHGKLVDLQGIIHEHLQRHNP